MQVSQHVLTLYRSQPCYRQKLAQSAMNRGSEVSANCSIIYLHLVIGKRQILLWALREDFLGVVVGPVPSQVSEFPFGECLFRCVDEGQVTAWFLLCSLV